MRNPQIYVSGKRPMLVYIISVSKDVFIIHLPLTIRITSLGLGGRHDISAVTLNDMDQIDLYKNTTNPNSAHHCVCVWQL